MKRTLLWSLGLFEIFSFGFFVVTNSFPLPLIALFIAILGFLTYSSLQVLLTESKIQLVSIDSLLLCELLVLAVTIYLFRIETITPGMWGDEVTIARVSEELFSGMRPLTPFVADNFGHPTPLMYIGGAILSVLGKSLMTVRLVSVIFATLSVGAFYVLLRSGTSRFVSFLGTLLFLTNYTQIVLARLAYEMSAAIFFQILSFFFLSRLTTKVTSHSLMLLGITIGLGFYTYLGWRLIGVLFIITTLILLHRTPKFLSHLLIFLGSLFFTLMPLLAFTLRNVDTVMARTKSISLLSQKLSIADYLIYLGQIIQKFPDIFLTSGDPSPLHNPGNVAMFDLITVGLAAIGCALIYFKRKKLFYFLSLCALFALANDLLSSDAAFNPRLLAPDHPHSLRLFALIVPVLLFASASLKAIEQNLNLRRQRFVRVVGVVLMTSLVFLSLSSNLHSYFSQSPSEVIYEANGIMALTIVKEINSMPFAPFYLSPKLYIDQRVQYFAFNPDRLHPLSSTVTLTSLGEVPKSSTSYLLLDTPLPSSETQKIIAHYPKSEFRIIPFRNPFYKVVGYKIIRQ